MTRLGRNAIRRSEKEARRRNREEKRGRRVAAGVAALATVAAVGAGQVMADAPARADIWDTITSLKNADPAATFGDLLGTTVNNEATQAILDQWRVQACASGGSSGGADCTNSTGTGLAVVLPSSLEVVPVGVYNTAEGLVGSLPDWLKTLLGVPDALAPQPTTTGSATVIGSGFQFALAYRDGEATAISYLPVSFATAGASDGKKAYAFALVGVAYAWNTGDLPVTVLGGTIATIPGVKSVGCYGGLTGGYAEGVGACANVLGTLDFRWNASNNQIQFGLTDPSAVLFDPTGAIQELLTTLLNGDQLNLADLLSDDFVRLTISPEDLLNGSFLRVTSDYGFTGPVTVDWLGQDITIYPTTTVNGKVRPNYIALPQITFHELDTGEIIPVLNAPKFEFPFGISSIGPIEIPSTTTTTTASPLSLTTTTDDTPSPSLLRTTTTTTDDTTEAEPEKVTTLAAPVDTTEDEVTTDKTADTTTTTTDNSTDNKDQSNNYVGKHRSENKGGYVGKHRSESKNDNEGSDNKGSDNKDSSSTKSDNKGSSENKSDDNGSSENKGSDSSSNSNSSNSSNNGSGNES
uniref:hypothetical protein n=1 Tax=Gordonia sp. B7-2 TaxID=3420932 RepID=UPI003D8F73A1